MPEEYIPIEQIKGVGLIFICSKDPLSQLLVSITKREFASIGFYYITTISGTKQINVLLNTSGSNWINLEKLTNDPLIYKIAIKRINSKLETKFRMIMAEITNNTSKTSLYESISNLFLSNGSVDFIDRAVILLGETLSVKKINRSSPFEDSDDKTRLLKSIYSKLEVKTDRLDQYIWDRNIFKKLVYIKLPERDKGEQKMYINKAILRQREDISKIISMYVDMIILDDEFYEKVIER